MRKGLDMKTTKQLSDEIFEKINARETARLQTKKRVKRIFASCLIFGFLTPVAMHFATTEELNHEQPLSILPSEDLPFDPDLPNEDSTETFKTELFSTL